MDRISLGANVNEMLSLLGDEEIGATEWEEIRQIPAVEDILCSAPLWSVCNQHINQGPFLSPFFLADFFRERNPEEIQLRGLDLMEPPSKLVTLCSAIELLGKDVKRISLTGCELGEGLDSYRLVIDAFKKCERLEAVVLAGSIQSSQAVFLGELFSQAFLGREAPARLTKIDLSNSQLGDALFEELCRSLALNQSLRELHIARNRLIEDFSPVSFLQNISLLDVRDCDLTDEKLAVICHAVGEGRITGLDVGGNSIEDEGARLLAQVGAHLHALNIESCGISVQGMTLLFESLVNLRSIGVGFNAGEADIAVLAVLKHPVRSALLERVALGGFTMTEGDVKDVCSFIANAKSLRDLRCGNFTITQMSYPDACLSFVEAAQKNSSLKTLDLRENSFYGTGEALRQLFSSNQNLRTVWLGDIPREEEDLVRRGLEENFSVTGDLEQRLLSKYARRNQKMQLARRRSVLCLCWIAKLADRGRLQCLPKDVVMLIAKQLHSFI